MKIRINSIKIKLIMIMCAVALVFSIITDARTEDVAINHQNVAATEAPAVKQQVSYTYDPQGRRDPFVPLIRVAKAASARKARVTGTLESYDIADFKLIAVINKGGYQKYALLLAPDNKSFTVKEGVTLGLNNGKVEKITADVVEVREFIKDYKGELRPRKIVLELHKGEEE